MSGSRLVTIVRSFAIFGIASASAHAATAERAPQVPDWLSAHVGEGNGQIALPVLQRARALYLSKVADGKVKNSCYFAMDATRPNDLTGGESGGRFYMICEADQTFRVISSGHGSGRNLPGVADFSNGRECAKNFGNALGSNLTAGGAYLTSEIKTSFKGYYRSSSGQQSFLTRSFVQFEGIGETANARERAIGGHPAALVSGICMQKKPNSPYANNQGYVPLGKFVNYAGGRSNGCTTWSPAEAPQVLSAVKDNPTTLYIYPESRDILAISKVKSSSQAGPYWNAACLKQIGTPRFWSQEKLGPLIVRYEKDHPAPPPKPIPLCEAQSN
ncbi:MULTISPECIES: murein L,D-transpeptidase catalytic domain family protein [unclassified Rhizobium]|uniref:murein L,D-transpeptidase catalytic domain family protein n=1 Tax=Rhizobium sp. BK418 TaxID=2512120 RepID=UPI001FDEC4F4|nr:MULTISPECIES: murein L,D-transpeptidase catalytic domain family protein [unclassified Rhizobium]